MDFLYYWKLKPSELSEFTSVQLRQLADRTETLIAQHKQEKG